MRDQKKEDRCLRIAELQASAFGGLARVSTGYEAGLFGAEGRGLYAGGTVAGIHGELTHIEDGPRGAQGSWGFHGSIYQGVTDEGNDKGADNTHNKVSNLLWIPELGSYGRFKIGASVDETKAGIQKSLKDYLVELAGEESEFAKELLKDYESGEGKKSGHISKQMLQRIIKELLEPNGYVKVNRGGKNKITYSKNMNQWGNIEFKTGDGGNSYYSSYNYAFTPIGHFWLDMVGYWLSN